MKNFVFWTLLLLTFSGFSQETGYEVFGTLTHPRLTPYSLITLDTLQEATTIVDINGKYRPNWVARYISVEVASNCQGVVNKATSTNDTLTHQQMSILKTAQAGCSIDVEIDYIPENTLKYNPPRKLNFTLRTMPIFEAKYPGGMLGLEEHLEENMSDKLSAEELRQIELAAVKFNINKEGQVADAQISQTSGSDYIDKQLLEAICNLPKWQPAVDAQGQKITQAFEFRMGTVLMRCDYYQY